MTTVRLNRDAFRRGVEDVMTFAPLRDAVKNLTSGENKRTSSTAVVKKDTFTFTVRAPKKK